MGGNDSYCYVGGINIMSYICLNFSYVQILNRNLKILMLIDIVPGSIQIACSLFQMVVSIH